MNARRILTVAGLVVLLVAAIVATQPAPQAEAASCKRQSRTVVVDLDNRKHITVLRHVWYAIRRDDQAERLTIDRRGADRNRQASLRRVPTRPGYDRDEYPPALSDEGGAGASVRYIRASINRSAGAVMGNQLEDYCDGQRFRFERRARASRR